MVYVEVSATVEAPADSLWATVGPFSSLGSWHPGVEACYVESGDGKGIGSIRRLVLPGGVSLTERLSAIAERSYEYELLESPLPVFDYVSSLSVAAADGERSTLRWSARFNARIDESEARALILGIYQAGVHRVTSLYARS